MKKIFDGFGMQKSVTWITGLKWKVYYKLFDMGKLHFYLSTAGALIHFAALPLSTERWFFHLISKRSFVEENG